MQIINEAAWLMAPGEPLRVAAAPVPALADGELLVRVRALAINPFDRIVQTLGTLVTPWLQYPAVLGSDVAGDVVATGGGGRFREGDRVLGLALGVDRAGNRAAEGAFQQYVVLREHCASRLAPWMSYEQAAVLPLALATAGSGLFLEDQLGLVPPWAPQARRPGNASGIIVVWGGSTSVGSCAIQLAAASGYTVLTTASPHNHDRLRQLGAAHVEDYRAPDVLDRLLRAIGSRDVSGVLAIGVGSGASCLALAARAKGPRRVAMASAPRPLDSAPLGRQALWKLRNLPGLGLGFGRLALQARWQGVRTSSIWGTAVATRPEGWHFFPGFVESALADRRLLPAPSPLVAGSSLADIPRAMERLRQGVSASKVVVRI
ncbi:MAG: zinc-binding alcohol dehydrogenase family protein [Bordetella sp.]|uniref:zinc-binding alcohol dehydrogenase family protein n=1 Tax=Bordetella sp. TaxID=28081 RepID=UPI003F7BF09A